MGRLWSGLLAAWNLQHQQHPSRVLGSAHTQQALANLNMAFWLFLSIPSCFFLKVKVIVMRDQDQDADTDTPIPIPTFTFGFSCTLQ